MTSNPVNKLLSMRPNEPVDYDAISQIIECVFIAPLIIKQPLMIYNTDPNITRNFMDVNGDKSLHVNHNKLIKLIADITNKLLTFDNKCKLIQMLLELVIKYARHRSWFTSFNCLPEINLMIQLSGGGNYHLKLNENKLHELITHDYTASRGAYNITHLPIFKIIAILLRNNVLKVSEGVLTANQTIILDLIYNHANLQ